MARRLRVIAVVLGISVAVGAQFYARKMEIVRTAEGEATVFRDSVVIIDRDTRIDARLARMYESRGFAVISDNVSIVNPDAAIKADSAYYHLKDRQAELFGNVNVRQESLDISAPVLRYSAGDKMVRAGSGLTLEDIDRSFRLSGASGSYDLANDAGVVDSAPVLSWFRRQPGRDSGAATNDSARVTSRRMLWLEKESRARAEGGVELHSGASTVSCDTVVFYSGPDSGVAWGHPEMRDSSSRARGDTMVFHVRQGSLERVGINGNASGTYRTEGGDVVDVSARSIRVWLAAGEVDHIEVSQMTSGQLTRSGRKRD